VLIPRVPSPSSPGKGLYNPKAFVTHAASLDQGCPHCPRFPTAASRRSLGRVSVPVWPAVLSDRLPIAGTVGRYPAVYLIGRGPIPGRRPKAPFAVPCRQEGGRSRCQRRFPAVVPGPGAGSHALLTRAPLAGADPRPLDLHVLGAPPAFVLSQDQTLSFVRCRPRPPPARPLPPRGGEGDAGARARPPPSEPRIPADDPRR
jgi:hypothetical protein